MSPSDGHPSTPTVAGLPGLCENSRRLSSHWATTPIALSGLESWAVVNIGDSLRRLSSLQHRIYNSVVYVRTAYVGLHDGAVRENLAKTHRSYGLLHDETRSRLQAGRECIRPTHARTDGRTAWKHIAPGWPNLNDGQRHKNAHTHTHPFNGPFSGTTQVGRYHAIWISLKQETVSGSGISWAICKSAPRSRQTTTPAPHHSVFTGRMPFLPPNQQC